MKFQRFFKTFTKVQNQNIYRYSKIQTRRGLNEIVGNQQKCLGLLINSQRILNINFLLEQQEISEVADEDNQVLEEKKTPTIDSLSII